MRESGAARLLCHQVVLLVQLLTVLGESPYLVLLVFPGSGSSSLLSPVNSAFVPVALLRRLSLTTAHVLVEC